jgi:hypothetical protein
VQCLAGEIEVHSEVVVNWATMDNKAIAIYCCKIGCKFHDLEGVHVQCFQIINVPGDHHLGAGNSCVGNAGVVWVDDEW